MEQVEDILKKVRNVLLWATIIILLLIIIACLILGYSLLVTKYPDVPVLNNIPPDTAKQQIANYKSMVEALQLRQTNIYDFVVIKTLLSIFNTIIATLITYVFTNIGLQFYKSYKAERSNKI